MLDAIDGRTKWRRRRHLLPILAVACLGLVVAVATWLVASTWEARLAKVNFANLAGDYASVLQNGLDQYLAKMIVMRAFLRFCRSRSTKRSSRFSPGAS